MKVVYINMIIAIVIIYIPVSRCCSILKELHRSRLKTRNVIPTAISIAEIIPVK